MRQGKRSLRERTGVSPFGTAGTDPDGAIATDFSAGGESALVLFGGIAGGVSMPVFEFFRLTAGYPTNKLYLRDPRRAWYLLGLPEAPGGLAGVGERIASEVARSGATRIIAAGSSAGGFAAIRFGVALGAAAVHAFSPQTFLDARQRHAVGDDRWREHVAAVHAAVGADAEDLDLRPFLERHAKHATAITIHVSRADPLDVVHADHLRGLPGVEVVEYAEGGHALVRWLRDTGQLGPLLRHAIGASIEQDRGGDEVAVAPASP